MLCKGMGEVMDVVRWWLGGLGESKGREGLGRERRVVNYNGVQYLWCLWKKRVMYYLDLGVVLYVKGMVGM